MTGVNGLLTSAHVMNSQIENFLDLIGNQSLDSDVRSRHEFPDLIFQSYMEVRYCKRFKIHAQPRYDSSKDIETIHLGTVFLSTL